MTASDGYNVNIATKQGGDYFRLGAKAGEARDHYYADVNKALSQVAPANWISWFDHFLGGTLRNEWTQTSGSAALGATGNGILTMTTGSGATNRSTLALGKHFSPASGELEFEARVTSVTAATARKIEIGLSDATTEDNGLAFSSHDSTLVAVANDAIVFAIDVAESVTDWKVCSVADGGTAQGTDTETAPTADTYQVFRIVIDSDQTAKCYIDGTLVATVTNAVGSTATLTPWITIATEASAAKALGVDYVYTSAPVA